ncbi:MAG: phasin family protein [Alphaproteobacteria bacterium]
MTQAGKKADMGMPFDLAQFGNLGAGGMESMAEVGRKMLEAGATLNKEIFDFVSARLSADLAAQQKLMQSTSFQDMQKVYTEYFQTASQQYMDEMQKLMTMASDTARDATDAVTKPRR